MLSKILAMMVFSFLSVSHAFGFWGDPCECWTGAYVGGNIGGARHTFSRFDLDYDWDGNTQELINRNFVGGFQVGYNYQMCDAIVGIEGCFDWVDSNKHGFRRFAKNVNFNLNLKRFGTLHARAGVLAGGFYLYFLGGAAYEKVTGSWIEDGDDPDSWHDLGKNLWGWTFGGGIEKCIFNRVSLRAQVMSLRFSDYTARNLEDLRFVINNDTLVGLVGINYRFW